MASIISVLVFTLPTFPEIVQVHEVHNFVFDRHQLFIWSIDIDAFSGVLNQVL